jgi:hypothetical protein
MKYLLTIFLFLSINVFTADRYVVCKDTNLTAMKKCVNDYLDSGYKTLSGLHAQSKTREVGTSLQIVWFQALIKE